MNDVIKNIVERRSIKKYKSDMVPTELIDEVLKAGTYAPSGMNRQSPIIIAITNKELRDKLSKLNAKIMGVDTDPFYGAPVVIGIHRAKEEFETEEGKEILKSLGITGDYEGIGNCILGYPDMEAKEKPRKDNYIYKID